MLARYAPSSQTSCIVSASALVDDGSNQPINGRQNFNAMPGAVLFVDRRRIDGGQPDLCACNWDQAERELLRTCWPTRTFEHLSVTLR